MTTDILETPPALTRSKRLKAATHAAHDGLDRAIMDYEPFSSRERYSQFVKVQHAFHRDFDALYDNAALDVLLPDLQGRRRMPLIEQDLADLGAEPVAFSSVPVFAAGWLYVAEGSNLGAAFPLKWAKEKLDLSETFGARHLAGAPEGRGLHWRTFTAALNEVDLSEAEEARVVAGAETAFGRVSGLVRDVLAR